MVKFSFGERSMLIQTSDTVGGRVALSYSNMRNSGKSIAFLASGTLPVLLMKNCSFNLMALAYLGASFYVCFNCRALKRSNHRYFGNYARPLNKLKLIIS